MYLYSYSLKNVDPIYLYLYLGLKIVLVTHCKYYTHMVGKGLKGDCILYNSKLNTSAFVKIISQYFFHILCPWHICKGSFM